MGFNWSRWKAKLWKSGIFLEGKSIVDKFISQFQRSVVEKKKNRISCEGTIATIHRLDEREVEVFEANSSLDIGSPPPRLFGEIDIRRWKAKLGGGGGNIELRGGEWIVQFYVMENGGVGATFNRLRLSATLDIRFVAGHI